MLELLEELEPPLPPLLLLLLRDDLGTSLSTRSQSSRGSATLWAPESERSKVTTSR